MKLDDASANKLTYYIAEDASDVAERLQHEMQQYEEWKFAGAARGVKQAMKDITEIKPHVIFCDWDLVGGSGFEVLQYIQNLHAYHPFIIFNTGFQSDHPEIAEKLINTYKPDAYILKPYWHKLKEQLAELLEKAKAKTQQAVSTSKACWLTDIYGKKYPVVPQQIICVLQSIPHPRAKIIYTEVHQQGKEFQITWKEMVGLLETNAISFFVTNKRYSIVTKKFIESYNRPMVYLKKINHKVEIVGDYIKDFEDWLKE